MLNTKNQGIPEWYAGKNIFITGSTGFMGKVLVEKLLRDCPGIKSLYLLFREKRGIDPFQRKEEFLNCIIFDHLKSSNPQQLDKIHIIKGDVTNEDLGIDEKDRKELIDNINIVFHCAANVRFDQPLRPMITMNVMGTLRMLQLAEQIKKLDVFVHVSTAYSHCNEDVLEERCYPPPHDPYGIILMVKTLDDNILNSITPRLLNGLPNTYAYSKAVTEGVVSEFGAKIPIIVCRPSIVTAAKKEPFPGWIEGVNGPSGLMVGAGRGIIRSMHCNPDYPSDVIPVDTAINAIIASGWDRSQRKSDTAEFLNVVLSHKSLPTWGESIETGKRIFYKNPLSFSLWYPDGSIKSNYYKHLFCVIFFHYLPAYFIDFFLFIAGQKPFLVRVQNRISGGLKVLQYYTTKIWIFKNDKMESLQMKLNHNDQETFDLSADQVNWEDYIYNYIVGIRTYLLKEPPETLPKSRKLLKKLYILDRFVTFAFYTFLIWLLWAYAEVVFDGCGQLFESTKKIYYTRTVREFRT